jgi:hypothetical protein
MIGGAEVERRHEWDHGFAGVGLDAVRADANPLRSPFPEAAPRIAARSSGAPYRTGVIKRSTANTSGLVNMQCVSKSCGNAEALSRIMIWTLVLLLPFAVTI